MLRGYPFRLPRFTKEQIEFLERLLGRKAEPVPSRLFHIGEVRVEPMKLPTSLVFYQDYKYGDDDGS